MPCARGGAEAADFDNDGDQDLYVTNLGPNVYFRNEGDGTFTRTSLLAHPAWGQCCSAVDYDNDGDLDLVIHVSEGRPVLLRNDTKGGHWLTLRLIGTKSNRDAVGARVIAHAGGKVQYHYLRGGGSYLPVSDRRIHLGLGEATTVDRIEIIWPLRDEARNQKRPAGGPFPDHP